MSHPPYDPSRPCPKCGNPIIATEHRQGHHGLRDGRYFVLGEFGDRMVRHCGRCDWRWYELPVDHDDDAERAEVDAWLASKT